MSIKEQRKSARKKSPETKSPELYVVPDSAIREYVESLGIFDLEEAATHLQAIADATGEMLENGRSKIKLVRARPIPRMPSDKRNKRYQVLMSAIVAAAERGPSGLRAAHLTADRALELAFRWTPEYFLSLERFRNKLRKNRLEEAGAEPAAANPPLRFSIKR